MPRIPNKDWLAVAGVASFLVLYGYVLGAFRGFPKGVDAYAHLTMLRFVHENWPHIRWNPYWYGGIPYYLIYAPLPHLITVGLMRVTGWPPEAAMLFMEAISLVATVVGLFLLLNEATGRIHAFLLGSLFLIVTPPFWGLIVSGGAYARILSLMWLPLSSYLVLRWNRDPRPANYILAVTVTAVGFSSHLQVGLFVLGTAILLTYFYTSAERLTIRLRRVFMLAVPSFLLAGYFYVPFILSRPVQFFGKPHLPGPINIVTVLTPDGWNILPLYVLFVLFLTALLLRFQTESLPDRLVQVRAVTKTFQTVLLLLFLYAFTSLVPPELYIFSPYDSPFYIVLYSSMLIGVLAARLKRDILRIYIPIILASLIFISLYQYPFLAKHVWDSGAESLYSGYYVSQQLVKISEEAGFRFGADWDGATSWFNYKYAVPQVLGFYDINVAPRADWNHLTVNTIWKDKDEMLLTNHLADWNSIKWLMVGFPHYNYEKFNTSSDYKLLRRIDTPTMYTMYLFEYRGASPIVSATNAVTVGVIGSYEYYASFFKLLSLCRCGSRSVIPVYLGDGGSLGPLEGVEVILLRPDGHILSDRALWARLAGPGEWSLIIDGSGIKASYPYPSPVTESHTPLEGKEWSFTLVDRDVLKYLDIYAMPVRGASYTYPEGVREGARLLLEHQGLPVIVEASHGERRVIWLGISLVEEGWRERNQQAAHLMLRLIERAAGFRLKNVRVKQLYDANDASATEYWRVSWTTPNATGRIDHNGTVIGLSYNFRDKRHDEQVNFLYNPPGTWNLSEAQYLYIRLFSNGEGHSITIYLEDGDYRDSYWFEFRLTGIGWREVIYPIDGMKRFGEPRIGAIDKIEIVLNDYPDTYGEEGYHTIYLKEISMIDLEDSIVAPRYLVHRPNPELVEIYVEELARGVLFKETHHDRWTATLVEASGLERRLNIHQAGPGFMFVPLPKETEYPARIVLKYEQSWQDLAGYLATALTSASLAAYVVASRARLPLGLNRRGTAR